GLARGGALRGLALDPEELLPGRLAARGETRPLLLLGGEIGLEARELLRGPRGLVLEDRAVVVEVREPRARGQESRLGVRPGGGRGLVPQVEPAALGLEVLLRAGELEARRLEVADRARELLELRRELGR